VLQTEGGLEKMTTPEYTLKYGTADVSFHLPRQWQTKTLKHGEPPVIPLGEVLAGSLEKPVGIGPFEDWVAPFRKILVIVPDVTRYAGTEQFLPVLYDKFLKDKEVKVVYALGNHRKQTEREQRSIVSDYIFEKVPSFDHDCFDNDRLTSAGQTLSGLEVLLNSALFSTDAVIVTGSINFHYLAGFGGGRKGIFPGVSGYETILGIHRKVFRTDRMGKHELAKSGSLHGNPMHEELMEGIALIKTPMFLINTVVDDKHRFLNIFSGDMRQAHESGCEWLMKHFSVRAEEKADVVLVSSGGFPKDINFIQAHKAIEHAMGAVRDDGHVIVSGKCEDGLGNPDFLKWFEYATIAEMEPHVRKADKVYAQTAYATRCKAARCNISLVSDLDAGTVRKMGLTPARTVQEAIDRIDDGREKLCYILPDGSNTLVT
jgi:lactate racemase